MPNVFTRAVRVLASLIAVFALSLHIHSQTPLPTFSDVTKAAGITFRHESGAFGKKYLPETMGSGGAFLDADGDGWQDILLLNSKDWAPRGRRSISALYKNNR